MRKIIFLISFFWFALVMMGQTHSSADRLFQEGDYAKAQSEYGALLKSYPRNALYLYRYARCAQELGDLTTALRYFELSGDRYDLKHFYEGEIYLQLWRTEEAIAAYQTYLAKSNQSPERINHVNKQIRFAEKLQRYIRRVERLQVIDSVEVSLDSMLYAFPLSHEAGTISLDTLGNTIYINQRGDRKLWSEMVDTQLYLLSSHRLLDEWTAPDTLPTTVNFTSKQVSPYLLNDGVTLYYAANDTNGLGGMDIYVSRYNISTEAYTTPENIGMPYNSPANEYLFLLDEIHQVGYLATDRFASEGKVHIYSFAIPEYKQYWKNIPVDSLIAYARLEQFERGIVDTTIHNLSTLPDANADEIGGIYFVINDSVVYYSTNDFRQTKAEEMYHEWVRINDQYLSEQQQLHSLRQQYAAADEDEKKELTPTILHLENNQNQLQIQCEQLLQSIRRIEIESNQQ